MENQTMLGWCFHLPRRVFGVVNPVILIGMLSMLLMLNYYYTILITFLGILYIVFDYMGFRAGDLVRKYSVRKSNIVKTCSVNRHSNQLRKFDELNK